MLRLRWQVLLGLGLVALSVILYGSHYLHFHDHHHIFIYMLGDLAFLPVEVLLVSLIIHQLLGEREKAARLEKLNVVIGSFFSTVGTRLLAYFSDFDPALETIRGDLAVKDSWSSAEFQSASQRLKEHEYSVDIREAPLGELRSFLADRKDLLLRMMENPTLLEHEAFTDMLRAVFHLADELEYRGDLSQLPDTDRNHLAGDVKRAYERLAYQWVDYVKYLKGEYPYLFSLAMRMNPFALDRSPLVA